MDHLELDTLQKNTIDLFIAGYNLFITGSAGTGKSYLVKQLVKNYHNRYPTNSEDLVVTSTTGLSSLNINGKTIHSWAGLNPKINLKDSREFILTIRQNNKLLNNWLFTKVLIIDEISMLDAELLDFLDEVAKTLRASSNPFGGIQLILTGDFYQLPPVTNLTGEMTPFSFKAECWSELIDYTICLTKNHRQEEKLLIKFLNYIRIGEVNDFVLKQLDQYHQNPNYSDDYSHLYPNKANVENHNLMKLNQLEGAVSCYSANMITKANKSPEYTIFPKDSVIVEKLLLKPGAFVILNKNIDATRGLVNGLQGVFQGMSREGSAIIKTSDGYFHNISKTKWEFNNFYVEQYPIRLAWALTIHKSQGMSIERLSVDIGDTIFSDGQVYVALSRAVNSKYLHVKNYSRTSIKANPQVNQFYQSLEEEMKKWYQYKSDEVEGKTYYENKISGMTSWKLPKDAIIITGDDDGDDKDKDNDNDNGSLKELLTTLPQDQLIKFIMQLETDDNTIKEQVKLFLKVSNGSGMIDNTSESDISLDGPENGHMTNTNDTNDTTPPSINNSQVSFNNNLCVECHVNIYQRDYFDFLDERICQACCTTNSDYRLMTKPELNTYFKGQITQKQIAKILETCHYKPQKNVVNPRFKPTKLYMLGHIKKQVGISKSTNSNQTNKKPAKSTAKKDQVEVYKKAFDQYFIENKQISEISEAFGVAPLTVENYIYKAYLENADIFKPEYLEKLGVSDEAKITIKPLTDKWKKDNNDEYPKLRFLKSKLSPEVSYNAIKIILYNLYSYKLVA